MQNFSKIAVTAFAALTLVSTPALAQVQSNAAIAAQCAATTAPAGTCAALVSAKVAALRASGLSTAEIDAEIAALVIALAETGQTVSADVLAEITAAISVAQAEIADPDIAFQVASINAALIAGEDFTTAALGAAASPS